MLGLHKIRDWYGRFERPISSFSLIGGFVFDAIFLKRADLFWENFWIFIHLFVVAVCIILINRVEHKPEEESNPRKIHFWLVNILQFFFGGLFSTFLVFYFRSAVLSASWPFLLLLVLAFVANERLKKRFSRLSFQISLFYLSLFAFLIFFVPVVIHRVGAWVFVLSGLLSLVLIVLFLYWLVRLTGEKFTSQKRRLTISISSTFLIINVLYFTNIIPPLPLSLKDSGIYHSVKHDANGNYLVDTEYKNWLEYFNLYPNFHLVSGDVVYAFSAVFSPAYFNTGVVHEWQRFDSHGDWVTEGRVNLSVSGGRDGGYRTYSTQSGLLPGHWRVNVLTSDGLVLGRLRFNVVSTNTQPILKTEVSN